MIEVVAPGPLTTVQDLGRPGLAELGVSRSGAADRGSLRLANRLVGNAESAAGLEITLGGLIVRFSATCLVALTGARCGVTVSGRQGFMYGPLVVRAGDDLTVGVPDRGLRTYLAVRGGIAVPPVLGSRSTDVLSGIGPEPLRPGAVLPVDGAVAGEVHVDVAPVAALPDAFRLRVLPGPRDDWFVPEALAALCSRPYEVTPESNRVGIRLVGPRLVRRRADELPPEGMVPGALQVPPSGQPVLFLADHPVTGGYPVIGVVDDEDLDLVAQVRPGDRLAFTSVSRPR